MSKPLTPLPRDDYLAIENAVMETERGRWFLAEYRARHREADTQKLLEALTKLEQIFLENSVTDNLTLLHAKIEKITDTQQINKEILNNLLTTMQTIDFPREDPLENEGLESMENQLDDEIFEVDTKSEEIIPHTSDKPDFFSTVDDIFAHHDKTADEEIIRDEENQNQDATAHLSQAEKVALFS